MVEKGKLFSIVECQLVNVEGMIKIENHHLVTILIIDSGKNHQ